MEKVGSLSVQAENIFPIIKRFLYEDREVFLRELVSNSVDACRKLIILANKGEFIGKIDELRIDVEIDTTKKEIRIKDNGIGMSFDEVERYLNQIAFSSAKEFIERYSETKEGLIGHFGLGFYSAFLVAESVEVITQSYRENEPPVYWKCDGSPTFEMKTLEGTLPRGTTVILHVDPNAGEFLQAETIESLLKRYARFLPIPIYFNGKRINDLEPLWLKSTQDLKHEDYIQFYKALYPYDPEPVFYVHLNIDYPIRLTGILYFPQLSQNALGYDHKIQLYVNQVFVTDDVRDILPEYLQILHGILDSPDLPLNVSRSSLQHDPYVKKVQAYIIKKVADALKESFQQDRKKFEKQWSQLEVFIKYASLKEEKFFIRIRPILLLKTVNNTYVTIEEWQKETESLHRDKDGNLVWLYATNLKEQQIYIQQAQKRGYKVLLFDSFIDSPFIGFLESHLEKTYLRRIDSDTIDKLIDKGQQQSSTLTKEQEETLKKWVLEELQDSNVPIEVTPLTPEDLPLTYVISEYDRRLKEMFQYVKNEEIPIQKKVIINSAHKIWNRLLLIPEENKRKTTIQHLLRLANLINGTLSGNELSAFLDEDIELLYQNLKGN